MSLWFAQVSWKRRNTLISRCIIFVKIALVLCAYYSTLWFCMPERYWNGCSWLLWAPCCHPGCNIFPRQVKEKGAKAVYQSVAVLLCQPFSRVKGMAVLLLTPWALGTQTLQAHLSCFHDFCLIFSFCVFFSRKKLLGTVVSWKVVDGSGSRCVGLGGWSSSSHLHSIVGTNPCMLGRPLINWLEVTCWRFRRFAM